jgi:hypothetical protein
VKALAPPPPQHISTPGQYRPPAGRAAASALVQQVNALSKESLDRGLKLRTLGEALRGR